MELSCEFSDSGRVTFYFQKSLSQPANMYQSHGPQTTYLGLCTYVCTYCSSQTVVVLPTINLNNLLVRLYCSVLP